MEQVPHQQAHEVARRRAGKRGIDPAAALDPLAATAWGAWRGSGRAGSRRRQRLAKAEASARPWRRRCARRRRAGGGGTAREGGAREAAAQCERWRAPRRLHAREVEARGSSGHREGAARRGRAARVGAVR